MSYLSRGRRLGAVGILVILLASACSSGAKKSSPGQAAAKTNGPNPNATESSVPGDIPDNKVFRDYTANKAFSLKVPEGWAMTTAGQAVLFTDKYNSIRIESLPAATAPTVASATSQELPAIKAAAHGFVAGDVKTVQRKSGAGVLITYRADSALNPVTNKVVFEAVERYEFWRNGTEVVLTLSAPVGSDNVDPWRTVTDSFGWKA
ncbi:MAG: hypothetical protein DLM58_18315 [Pseudonocardiales bacterium]|nr:MAG: hypothetical protein DLM58_18315 [Pseudonocardiales bacterium]